MPAEMLQPRKLSRRRFLQIAALGLGALAAIGFEFRQYLESFIFSLSERQAAAHGFDQLDDTLYDVVIIGSGPAGSVLGTQLVSRGIKTLILEAGSSLANPDANIQAHRLEVVRNSGSVEYPIASTRIRAVGGTSLIWTGRAHRLHPIDFETNAYTPEGGEWPFRYADIEPYYARAEKTLRVRGGELSSFTPPRSTPLPYRVWIGEGIDEVNYAMKSLDIDWDFSPTSTGVANHSQPMRMMSDLLPEFADSPHGTLVAGAVVTNIVPDADGNVEHLEVQDYNGNVRTVRGQRYVVACGGVDSAKLLLQSRSDVYPNGFGNNNDIVGRFFNEHHNITMQGKLPSDKIPARSQLARSHTFYEDFKERGLGSVILWSRVEPNGRVMVGTTTEVYPHPDNRVTLVDDMPDGLGNPGLDMSFSLTEKDMATEAAVYELLESILVEIGATEIEKVYYHEWAHHHYGTCRMGNDPETSVVDANLRVHSANNLHVLSSATFVTGGGGHPTILIVALAHRLSEHLAEVLVADAETEVVG